MQQGWIFLSLFTSNLDDQLSQNFNTDLLFYAYVGIHWALPITKGIQWRISQVTDFIIIKIKSTYELKSSCIHDLLQNTHFRLPPINNLTSPSTVISKYAKPRTT